MHMSQSKWTSVDEYFSRLLIGSDEVLERTLKKSSEAGLPEIYVAPNQGKLLQLLATALKAKRILEIGTLGGYSTIWLARGMQDGGKLITLEYEPSYAKVAKDNIKHAGLSDVIEIRVGLAIDSLRQMEKKNVEPFDLVFIDADKPSNPEYLRYALKFSHSGTMIIGDNVVRDGEVINENSNDPKVKGVRQFLEMLSDDSQISATAIQTVGNKGYDGFSIAIVQ